MDAPNTEVPSEGTRKEFEGVSAWLRRVLAALGQRNRAVIVAVIAVLAVGLYYWFFAGGTPPNYVTVTVTKGTIARAVTATGSINPVLTVTVGSYVSGVIQDIECDFNTKVTKGQLCARIDPRPYQTIIHQDEAAVAAAQAQLLKDQASLAYARINADRLARLLAQHATSRASYDVAVDARNQASAQVVLDRSLIIQRQAALDAARVNLGYTNIVSPVDGTVVSRNVTKGQTVAASFQTPTLFLIATDLSKMQVDTNVSESDIGRIRVGNNAEFQVAAFPDDVFKGRVIQVRQAPQTVQNVVTYDVVIEVENKDLLLKPGMTATVRIITAKRENVVRVPDQALRYVPGGLSSTIQTIGSQSPALWILRNRRLARVGVRTGLDDDSYTEIISGDVRVGDKVIVSERSTAGIRTNSPAPAMRFP